MRPLSDAVAKELLPVGLKPALTYHVEDLAAAGIRRIVVMIAPHKESIPRYLRNAFPDREFQFVVQDTPTGLGFAIHGARAELEDEPFMMLLPDNIFFGAGGLVGPLRARFERSGRCAIPLLADGGFKAGARAVYEVSEPAPREPSIAGMHDISRIPPNARAYYGPAAAVFTSEVFAPLEAEAARWSAEEGELSERPALRALVERNRLDAVWLRGRCFDIGTLEGYADCQRFALARSSAPA